MTETVQDRTTLLVGTPKSRAGQRIVDDLPADLCQRLAAHVANKADDDYVFGKGDKPLRWRNWTGRVWRPALKRLGLNGVRFHDLRHYHASAVLLITADPMYTCRRLGHANPSFTMNAYGHVLKHEGRKVADGLAALRAEGRARAQRTVQQERPTSVVDLASYRRSKGA